MPGDLCDVYTASLYFVGCDSSGASEIRCRDRRKKAKYDEERSRCGMAGATTNYKEKTVAEETEKQRGHEVKRGSCRPTECSPSTIFCNTEYTEAASKKSHAERNADLQTKTRLAVCIRYARRKAREPKTTNRNTQLERKNKEERRAG